MYESERRTKGTSEKYIPQHTQKHLVCQVSLREIALPNSSHSFPKVVIRGDIEKGSERTAEPQDEITGHRDAGMNAASDLVPERKHGELDKVVEQDEDARGKGRLPSAIVIVPPGIGGLHLA